MTFSIMCSKCRTVGTIQGRIPKKCPRCGNPFDTHTQERTLTDVIYNLFVKKKADKGFFECNRHGWVKGEALEFPDEI